MFSNHSLLVHKFLLYYVIFKTFKKVFPSPSLRQKTFHHTKSSLGICSPHPHPTLVLASDRLHFEFGKVIVYKEKKN